MSEAQASSTDEENQQIRDSGPFILSGLSAGHAVFHWFSQSFFVMLPEVVATFGLNGLQVGAISATREVISGIIALPGGLVTDMVHRHWGAVLATCMGLFGLGWLIMGIAPVYFVLLIGMAVVALAASMWHLPAAAALSRRFVDRKGTALSIHGVGGNLGDVLGPALTGVLLLTLGWRGILSIYAVIPLLLTVVVFWAFRNIGKSDPQTQQTTSFTAGFKNQIANTRISFAEHPRLWGIMAVAGLRGMANVAFLPFLALYLGLDEELGLGNAALGLHIALLVGVGVVATPAIGYISDRFGRKLVLIPGMLTLCILTALLVPFGEGTGLVIILALMGIFFFSDQPILTAAALDVVGQRVAASTLGVFSFSRFVLAASSPLIAGKLFDSVGIESTFIYISAIYLVASVILMIIPLAVDKSTSEEGEEASETNS